MVLVNDNQVIIKYKVNNKEYTKNINYINQIHILNTNMLVTEMTIGNNLSVYGFVVTKVNNQNLSIYKHFTGGIYNIPISFLTFHVNKVN
jgi:hypothetical protein